MHSSQDFILKFTCLENGVIVSLLQTASLYWSTEQHLLLWQVATRPINIPSINRYKIILVFLETEEETTALKPIICSPIL